MTILALILSAAIAQPSAPTKDRVPRQVPGLTLSLHGARAAQTADISAEKVSVKVLIERLREELKIPIQASSLITSQTIDLSPRRVSLPVLLGYLAPIVLADVEAAPGETGTWKALHLLAQNDKEPPPPLSQTGFLLMAGVINEDGTITEPTEADAKQDESPSPADDSPGKPLLAVSVRNGAATVKARQQPVIAILNQIASKAGVPFDLRGQPDMTLIDIEFKDVPLRDVPTALAAPDVRMVLRRNLVTGDEMVRGFLVVAPQPAPLQPPRPPKR